VRSREYHRRGAAQVRRRKHEPGGFYNLSPANTQLAAVIVERATGTPFENYVDERVWRVVGAGSAQLQLDRRAGMPAAHCCWRATARDMLRVLNLLGTDGKYSGRAVLPEGWVREMARPSRVNAETGMQVARLNIGGDDALGVTDDNGSAYWVIPRRELAILNIAVNDVRVNKRAVQFSPNGRGAGPACALAANRRTTLANTCPSESSGMSPSRSVSIASAQRAAITNWLFMDSMNLRGTPRDKSVRRSLFQKSAWLISSSSAVLSSVKPRAFPTCKK
jgi:hypothetical protein